MENNLDVLNYSELIKKYSWILEKDHYCILSPDSDGLLCGLLMSYYLNWKVVGYYDGKILIKDKKTELNDCIFLDMEIFRDFIRSAGHHIVIYSQRLIPELWTNLNQCIQPNLLRGYYGQTHFKTKYPLGMIHLLIGILNNRIEIQIGMESICPLLFTDGTFKNLFNYPENCLSWLHYLGADNKSSALHKIFFNECYTITSLMIALKELFKVIGQDDYSDKIKISTREGKIDGLQKENSVDTPYPGFYFCFDRFNNYQQTFFSLFCQFRIEALLPLPN
ncbi:MAG: hypothetical protein M0R67_02835 [Candidatus Cloacimonas sp.]|nr:hypothetical protein [Candidatus Cloacimonas sp.]